ncbi:MAG: NAD(P)H-dependent oxidoreductase subunit E [Verrucomicrobia bacterium]|nr:MAG: NAD(P)H-dependent oxidoreductase subunit E [Verrucomicrobiota bacterium]
MNLSEKSLEKIESLIPRFPLKQSAVLPLLHIIQEEKGYISKEDMEWIANKLAMEPINVYGLVTFYPMLREKPTGRRHIKVCRTLSCALQGSYKLCQKLQEDLNCPLDGTSEDGNYTIEFVECLASCGTAPVVQVDHTLYENVTLEKVADFVNTIREETSNLTQNF